MSLQRFQEALLERFPTIDEEISIFVDTYIRNERKQYMADRGAGLMTFGKFKGHSIDSLAIDEKGREYLKWLLAQSFFTEEKFSALHQKLTELGIKRTPKKKKDAKERGQETEGF